MLSATLPMAASRVGWLVLGRALRDLTELDRIVLGVVAKFGPMSAYRVRRHFSGSPASRFSSSSGSIYPLLGRLEERGLIEGRDVPRGRQARRELGITRSGRSSLLGWLREAPGAAELDPPADPLRTRLFFVGLLTRREQERFFEDALAGLRDQVKQGEAYVQEYAEDGPEAISRLAARGGIHVTRARLRWLTEVRDAMLGSGDP